MFAMHDPAGTVNQARESEELDAVTVRCLRATAKNDHQLANQQHHRSYGERVVSHRYRCNRLNTISMRNEARAADLAMEAR